ncbi:MULTISPECIES: YtxH domain-containing protein [Mesobacillus]|uniref:YtxH domain-containing protein n=2 Tax=Mesobacillus TaxID=2675231 RepID=A0A0D6ZCS2_9BACI|nr:MULTISPECIES: YtxH domain-containing protein [Mesobacillus]KIY23619.1 hypothetical protein UB32_01745 [Mesobacillus subterraneus]MDQ0413040.1 gas vesicle protein [Mesobacillus stamsii]
MNREQSQYDGNDSMRENNSNNSSSRDFITGAIVGGLAGALTALLLAPKSGQELRGALNEQSSTLKTKSIDIASVAKEKASDLKETVTQQSSSLINKIKDRKDQSGQASPDSNEEQLEDVPTSMAESSSMEMTHTATGEELQKKLEETQKAFDETESKLNQ